MSAGPGLRLPAEPVVLAVNPGSSSLKAAVRSPAVLLEVEFERQGADPGPAMSRLADLLGDREIRPDVVVHRVVHGGPDHDHTVLLGEAVLADLQRVVPLAPLHLPTDLASIRAARATWPDAAHVACFDTAFHASLPDSSRRLPVAPELVTLGVRRYGFHGLSVQSVLRARPEIDQAVIAHLGSGCSVTAVAGGRSRHTTMSLTPTGGIPSSTRSGDLDPEIVLYLIEECGRSVSDLRQLLDRHSGLAGLADGRRDMRDLLAADDTDARLALDIFVRSTSAAVAECAMTLDRFDTLVFTGGVGEHAVEIRDRVCGTLLRVVVPTAGEPADDPVAALESAGIHVLVVPADEQVVMDDEARALLRG